MNVRRALYTVAATGAALLSIATPASAAYPTTFFSDCGPVTDCNPSASGNITWYNRTAYIDGGIYNYSGQNGWAVFTAYAGGTKVDTVVTEVSVDDYVAIEENIGDSSLVGGIDRIKVAICVGPTVNSLTCGTATNYPKPS